MFLTETMFRSFNKWLTSFAL